MIERPIPFSAPMVRAILAGHKVQTRRVVKITHRTPSLAACLTPPVGPVRPRLAAEFCPYGMPGDRLWVRETHQFDAPCDGTWAHTSFYGCKGASLDMIPQHYRSPRHCLFKATYQGVPTTWRPSIHMPRWASRILLEVTDVRVERLQAISAADAMAEGAEPLLPDPMCSQVCPEDYVAGFRKLWDSINAANRPKLPANVDSKRYARVKAWLEAHPDTSGWAANPWVWVVSFKQVEVA